MGLKDLFRRKKIKKIKLKSKALKKKAPKPKKKVIKKKALRKIKKRAVKEKPVEINRNECPECGSDNVVIGKMTGNTICQDCGAIFAGLTPEVEKKFEEVKKQG